MDVFNPRPEFRYGEASLGEFYFHDVLGVPSDDLSLAILAFEQVAYDRLYSKSSFDISSCK